jgi:hypothetical protein
MAEKGYFEKLAEATKKQVSAGFSYAKTTSLGKGFISATKSITGYDIDGEDPTQTANSKKKKSTSLKSLSPDNTKAAAVATDEPFSVIDTSNSIYYL